MMASGNVVVVIFAGCLLLCAAAALQPNGTDCTEVRRTFVVKGIGQAQLVPETWTKGDDLELCPSSQTCCSKSMEEKYLEAVKKDMKSLLQGVGSYLKTLISFSASKFRDTFLDLVEIAENSTYALFAEVYKALESEARIPLSQLFADFLAYLNGQPVDLEERVHSFFDSLFPLAYRHSLNSNQEFSDTFKECLKDGQVEIRPFSDLPEKIALQISRSFETARTFLQALNLAVEVINTTEHMDFDFECKKAFVRQSYCPHCQGLINARPCAGICLNVARGCLSSVSELDSPWSEYISALERLTSGMVGMYNIEQVLSSFDNKISETIMFVNENAVEISKRVKQKCGTPVRRMTREVAPVASNPSSSAPYIHPMPEASLYMLLQNFVHKMSESKDFYANLADRLCTDGNVVVKGELRCWNGNDLGDYTKSVAGIGVTAQKYNPEMKGPDALDVVVKTMADKLQHIKQELNNQVTSVPLSDSSVLLEGSGSGGAFSDDEDYAGASGSGDFQKGTDGNYDSNNKGTSVAGVGWNKAISIPVLLVIVLLSSCLQFQLLRWQ